MKKKRTKKRLTLFAHWDPDDLIDETVISYLKEIKKFSDIVFSSDCNLPDFEIGKIQELVIEKNIGKHGEYDFGSYKRAYLKAGNIIKKYDEMILANDSCYGGFTSFRPLFETMETREDLDYWGIVEYTDKIILNRCHLQSFFILLNRDIFTSEVFYRFINNIQKQKSKLQTIKEYEIGLSVLLEEAGYKRGAYIRHNANNICYRTEALDLVTKANLPLIKRALLAENPYDDSKLFETFRSLPINVKDKALILNHLNRFTAGRYVNNSFFPLMGGTFLHRRILRWKLRSNSVLIYISVKFFGITLAYLPLRKTPTNNQIIKIIHKDINPTSK